MQKNTMKRIPLPSIAEIKSKTKGTLFDTLDLKILAIEDRRIEFSMRVSSKHLAPNHFLHGGAIVSLADSACGIGAATHLPIGASSFTTIELKTNFLGTCTSGELRCIATPHHLGRRTQVWDANVTEQKGKNTIALFRCTQMILWPK
tara:strand:- start:959 stop:1399 length:441 start_codon:yes stop_codon:yes gene_type:complete